MKKILSSLFLMIIILACSTEKNHSGKSSLITYNIDYKNNNQYFWDDYFEYSHHIVLETSDESIFKEITKLIINNNRIYILCGSMNRVIIFDMSGKFINSICHYGEGPEEYLSAADICVDNQDVIEILDKTKSRINKYTIKGDFVGTRECIAAGAFLRINEDCYLFNRDNTRKQIEEPLPFNFLCIKGDSIVTKDIQYVPTMAGRAFHYGEGSSLIYSFLYGISIPHNDTLYVYNKTDCKLERSCVFDFRINRPKGDMPQQQVKEYLQKYNEGDIPSSLFGLQMVGDYMFGMFFYENSVKHVLISMSDGKSLVGPTALGKDRIPILPVSYTSDQIEDNYIMTVLPSYFVKKQKEISPNTFLHTIDSEMENEESNPSLIFYRLKR